MHHLISHIGLKFILSKLQGTLTYEHTKSGRPAKQYDISETDIEDADDSDINDTDTLLPLKEGIDASAVGVQLRLIKNDGYLRMKFEGRDGNAAEWHFEGLQAMGKGNMAGSAGTQTIAVHDKCILCGREELMRSTTQDIASQTEIAGVSGIALSNEAAIWSMLKEEFELELETQTATINDGATKAEPATATNQKAMRDESCQTEPMTHTTTELKRKASSTSTDAPLHKRAKSRHDSQPWPRVIHMACHRIYPTSKSGTGILTINVEDSTVWYEDTHGKPHARTNEKKQVDVHKPNTRVRYQPNLTLPRDGATHRLDIDRLKRDKAFTPLVTLHCAAPGWKTWYHAPLEPGVKVYITDPEVVVDALVHCIDRASGREAVHDPQVDYEMEALAVDGNGAELERDARGLRREVKAMYRVYEAGGTGGTESNEVGVCE